MGIFTGTEELRYWRQVNDELKKLGVAEATIGEFRAHSVDLKYGGAPGVADLIVDDRHSRLKAKK